MRKQAEWKKIRFRMYYIEFSSRRGTVPIVKQVTGRGIVRWKTQRKRKFLEQK
jgi:hypothetical protein